MDLRRAGSPVLALAGAAALAAGCRSEAAPRSGPAAAPAPAPRAMAAPQPPPDPGPALKTYMGRTIARTMHWSAGGWLLRTEREREESTAEMLEALEVAEGWTVADLGCGNGYHTLELARRAGPAGRVLAVELQTEYFPELLRRAAAAGLENVECVVATAADPCLPPASCDLILLADVYHELSHPPQVLAALRRALRPGGRLALLEFRAEDPEVPIKRLHKMSRAQMLAELEANGFEVAGEYGGLPWQHLLFFRAREAPRPGG
ncbi:MAG: methyltransferase domain-containing protein [Planctomycetota bacterium]|nr:methyltransferase domain-containing protein [Planctomycetota bacterium]MDP6763385.1 methyltransferase domain-containing protein [Planctomycetota bacterium]MDP6988653.1 methyltransferase domain-containing protein [Planctomycetota bacterium]